MRSARAASARLTATSLVSLVAPGALWSLLALLATPAAAYEFRALGVASGFLTTAPAVSDLTDAEMALSLRLDLRRVKNRFDFRFDGWLRVGLVGGNDTVGELRELSATARKLAGRIDVTLGRFSTPGGFWLIADGAMLTARYVDTPELTLVHSIYGGVRAFTTARRNADLVFDGSAVALPLAGTSISLSHRIIDTSLTFTYAKEAIDLQSTWSPGDAGTKLDRYFEDEFFLDAQMSLRPSEKFWVAGGASLGTRYDVQFNAQNSAGPVQIGTATLGSISGWTMAELRPVKTLRLQYSFDFERIHLIQSHLLSLGPTGTPVAAANGSFEDHTIRAAWRPWKAVKLEARYRLRFRENTDIEHHGVLDVRGDDLWRGLGAFAGIGFDDIVPGVTIETKRILYSGGLSYVRPFIDLRAGVQFTDGIGSGLTFSQHRSAMMGGGTGASPTELFPYVLESNRIAFIRLFASWRWLFVGIDVEENLDSVQLRSLVQIGAVR